ncbi:MAG TPA: peptidoglycan peptidase, partial [Cyclobacteriaceae bacterium]|nr:peptidoglycan peptidase [Cyclobacteriaceae bacterium]
MRNKLILLIGGLVGAYGLFALTIRLMGDPAPESQTLKSGDIIFQTSQSSQSKAIQLATRSEYSHMGIIYM